MWLLEPVVGEEVNNFVQATKDGVSAFEWCLPEECFKYASVIVPARFELSVGHRDLVQIGEQGGRLDLRTFGGGILRGSAFLHIYLFG